MMTARSGGGGLVAVRPRRFVTHGEITCQKLHRGEPASAALAPVVVVMAAAAAAPEWFPAEHEAA
jgi:hypothetical protein